MKPHILETKNVGLYTWRRGGRGQKKVYCMYTHENVDIFGWPLKQNRYVTGGELKQLSQINSGLKQIGRICMHACIQSLKSVKST